MPYTRRSQGFLGHAERNNRTADMLPPRAMYAKVCGAGGSIPTVVSATLIICRDIVASAILKVELSSLTESDLCQRY